MDERRPARGLPLFGVAAAGTVLGHWLAYLIAIPGETTRARVLGESGHGYWLSAVQVAMALAGVALALVAVRRLRSPSLEPADGSTLLRLAFYQVSLFVVVEIIERLVV